MTDSILIFEDEGITSLHLRTLLTDWGFSVSAVADEAEKAADLIEADRPDVVLMDIHLKGKMDGIEAAELIHDQFGIPVVFLSAHNDDSTRRRIEASRAYGLVVKPFDERDLYVAVKSALYRRQIEQALEPETDGSLPQLPRLGDAVVATDAEGRIVYMNETAEELTGWKDTDAFENEATGVIHLNEAEDGTLIPHPVSGVLHGAEKSDNPRDSVMTSRSGAQQPTSHRVKPVLDNVGELVGAVVTIRRRKELPLDGMPVTKDTTIDALTGLVPPTLLTDFLSDAIALARNRQTMVAVFHVNIDNLGKITEQLGPEIGKELLTAAAARLQDSLRAADPITRIRDHSFVVIQPNLEQANGAVTLGEKLARVFQRPFNVGKDEIPLMASVGAALYPGDGNDPTRLQGRAKEAAEQARDTGSDPLRFHSKSVESAISEERTLGEDLESAITENQLEIMFQPVFDLTTRAIVGADARLSWRHPDRGIVPASTFLPIADRHGTSELITDWTIRKTLRLTAGWQPVAPGIRVSVPISGSELRRRTIVPHLMQILDDTGFDARHLELGIGEDLLVTRPPITTQLNLQRLRQLGVSLTLEKFGFEYASMMTLRKMPVHRIKIDGSLVAVVSFEKEAQAIVKATIDLARSCGLEVSAEGIEDESQWRWLRYHGCEIGQGKFLTDFLSGQDVFEKLVDQRF